jgi:adenosylhomocysteine nucleosidase
LTRAFRSEYGPLLQSKIDPLVLGIGPVEAGGNLTAKLGELYFKNTLPDLIVSLGSAGSKCLPEKEVFQVTAVSYRDMDVSLLGYEKGCTPSLICLLSSTLDTAFPALKEPHCQPAQLLFQAMHITKLERTWLIWKPSRF